MPPVGGPRGPASSEGRRNTRWEGEGRRARRLNFGTRRSLLLRKEVIQPLVPQRLPCYDFIPITTHTLGRQGRTSGADGFHDVTGGVYKARERIHGAVADAPLLANPTSRGRVADPDPNWGRLWGVSSASRLGVPLYRPL